MQHGAGEHGRRGSDSTFQHSNAWLVVSQIEYLHVSLRRGETDVYLENRNLSIFTYAVA